MKKLFVTLNAIPISLYRKNITGVSLDNPNLYSDIFNKYGSGNNKNNKQRIYIPLGKKPVVSKIRPNYAVANYLAANGYTIDNYIIGTAIMPDGKRTIKIGKVLSKEPELKKLFDNDSARSAASQTEDSMLVVISRHPYDILGSSFDRGWDSCTHLLKGENAPKLRKSLKFGLLVAYLIKNTEEGRKINSPSARILIRPYFNKGGKVFLLMDYTDYGVSTPAFRKTVATFVDWANSDSPDGKYSAPVNMYLDSSPKVLFNNMKADEVRDGSDVKWVSDINELKKLAAHTTNTIRIAVMDNPRVTTEILRIGVEDDDRFVRRSAVMSINADEEILELALKSGKGLEILVVYSENVTKELLLLAISIGDGELRTVVYKSKKADQEILLIGIKDEYTFARYYAANNRNATDKVLEIAIVDEDLDVCMAAWSNPSMSNKMLVMGAESTDPKILEAVMTNTSATEDILIVGAKSENVEVRCAVFSNKNTPRHILMLGIKDKSPVVRKVLYYNTTDVEILMFGAKDELASIRLVVMKNIAATLEVFKIGKEDSNREVKSIAKYAYNAIIRELGDIN